MAENRSRRCHCEARSDESGRTILSAKICKKGGKILLGKAKTDDYWTYVGGKAGFRESTQDAVLREFREELGVNLQIDRLLAVIENFFTMNGTPWHQFLFFYLLEDPEDQLTVSENEQEIMDNRDGVFQWFSTEEIDALNIKPACTKAILKTFPEHVLHIVNKE